MLFLPSRSFLEAMTGVHLLSQCSVLTPIQEAGLKGDGRAPHGGVWPVWGQTLSGHGEDNVCSLFFLLSSMWHPSSAAQARQVGLKLVLPLLQGFVGPFPLPAPCPVAPVHRTLKGVCSHSVRTPLTQRGRKSGRRGARRDYRGYGPFPGLRDVLFAGAGT